MSISTKQNTVRSPQLKQKALSREEQMMKSTTSAAAFAADATTTSTANEMADVVQIKDMDLSSSVQSKLRVTYG